MLFYSLPESLELQYSLDLFCSQPASQLASQLAS